MEILKQTLHWLEILIKAESMTCLSFSDNRQDSTRKWPLWRSLIWPPKWARNQAFFSHPPARGRNFLIVLSHFPNHQILLLLHTNL